MKPSITILISILIFLVSCKENKSNFEYDPSVPYPLLNAGDSWLEKFDQRGLQNAIIYRDRIYCNTIDLGGEKNFLYCLNPLNGLVVWRGHVDACASQPASFQDDIVIYVSFLGDIAAFDKEGTIMWKSKFAHPYGGHWVDRASSTLFVKTVYWKYVSEFNVKSGTLISDNENDSLQKVIETKMKDERLSENHVYKFERNGKVCTIKCRPSRPGEVGEYTIEIGR